MKVDLYSTSCHSITLKTQNKFFWIGTKNGKEPLCVGFKRGCECELVGRPVEFMRAVIQGSGWSQFADLGDRIIFPRFSHYCLWCCDCQKGRGFCRGLNTVYVVNKVLKIKEERKKPESLTKTQRSTTFTYPLAVILTK